MSFIAEKKGTGYEPGYFLAHEECTRETRQFIQTGATTTSEGGKYVPMGTIYTVETEVEGKTVTDYVGIVYEDVDVTNGNMPGSVVTKGEVYENRLPVALTEAAKTALETKGFVFKTEPTVTRPNFD